MRSDELNALVTQELQMWGVAVLQRLASEMHKKKVVLTQETLKSLHQQVLQTAAAGTQQLHLAFADSGRIQDMKRVGYGKLPPVEAIEKWVKDVGVSRFGYVPGYGKGNFPISESAAIKRIAWGIAANKLANNVHKPKKWFAKPFYEMLNPLIDNIVTKYQEATGEVIGGIAKF